MLPDKPPVKEKITVPITTKAVGFSFSYAPDTWQTRISYERLRGDRLPTDSRSCGRCLQSAGARRRWTRSRSSAEASAAHAAASAGEAKP